MEISAITQIRLLNTAQRMVERVALRYCTPEEYSELAPQIQAAFDHRRSRVTRPHLPAAARHAKNVGGAAQR